MSSIFGYRIVGRVTSGSSFRNHLYWWIGGWASLIDGIVQIVSLGMWTTSFSEKHARMHLRFFIKKGE